MIFAFSVWLGCALAAGASLPEPQPDSYEWCTDNRLFCVDMKKRLKRGLVYAKSGKHRKPLYSIPGYWPGVLISRSGKVVAVFKDSGDAYEPRDVVLRLYVEGKISADIRLGDVLKHRSMPVNASSRAWGTPAALTDSTCMVVGGDGKRLLIDVRSGRVELASDSAGAVPLP